MDLIASWLGVTHPVYLGVALAAVVFGAYMAWTIGANDVANAMATSVGSGTLTYRQAIVVAGVMEFAGAVLAGSHVTNTIRKGIVNVDLFQQDPQILMIGMLAALLAAALWLHAATLLGLPVSTTHSIVGAVVGFALLVYGMNAVNWGKVMQIILSWVVSPVAGGAVSYVLFRWIRRWILASEDPGRAMQIFAPFFAALTSFIIVLSAIYKGLKNVNLTLGGGTAVLLAAAVFVVVFLAVLLYVRSRGIETYRDLTNVERVFMVLQAITAAYVAFAHGANDVANAIGPVAAVIATAGQGIVALKVQVPMWILVMGGGGIVIGLATYGYKVIRTVGTKITELTPTRGFAAEFAAATVVLAASKAGLPISTTHTLVGSVLGVGLAQGIDAINLKVVRSVIASWLLTLPIAAGLAMILFFLLRAVIPVG